MFSEPTKHPDQLTATRLAGCPCTVDRPRDSVSSAEKNMAFYRNQSPIPVGLGRGREDETRLSAGGLLHRKNSSTRHSEQKVVDVAKNDAAQPRLMRWRPPDTVKPYGAGSGGRGLQKNVLKHRSNGNVKPVQVFPSRARLEKRWTAPSNRLRPQSQPPLKDWTVQAKAGTSSLLQTSAEFPQTVGKDLCLETERERG